VKVIKPEDLRNHKEEDGTVACQNKNSGKKGGWEKIYPSAFSLIFNKSIEIKHPKK
jgi:hypothetical protein